MKKVMSEMRYGRCVCERETERQLDNMRVDEIEGENFQEKGRQYILALLRSQPYQSLYDMHINYAANNTIKRDGTKGPGPRLYAMFYRGASSNLLNILCFFLLLFLFFLLFLLRVSNHIGFVERAFFSFPEVACISVYL